MKILITGASQGLGLATTKLLLANQHQVIGVSRNCPAHLLKHPNFQHVACDFTLDADCERFKAFLEVQKIDFLINNFAFFGKQLLDNLDFFTFTKMQYLNCYLPLETARILNRAGCLQGVVNISSLGGLTDKEKFSGFGGYAMSKAALTTLSQTMAVEYSALRILCIAPGAMKTPMLTQALGAEYPGGIEPEKVAELIAYFLTEQGRALDGQVIVINSN